MRHKGMFTLKSVNHCVYWIIWDITMKYDSLVIKCKSLAQFRSATADMQTLFFLYVTQLWISDVSIAPTSDVTDLQRSALVRKRRTEEWYQDIHHSRRYIVLQHQVGMVPVMRCNAYLTNNQQQSAVIVPPHMCLGGVGPPIQKAGIPKSCHS